MGISGQKSIFFGRTSYQKEYENESKTIFKSNLFQ